MIDVEKLKKLHEFATKGDLSTAERHVAEEHIECPVCQGDGEVLSSDYCNIDGKALGVQFYGIGKEFGAHEALWSFLRNSVPAILAMAEERDRLRHRLELREPDWPESADGVACRDDTIALLDERVARFTAENARLREALERIADHNKVRDWTATSDNPETHWVTRDGFYAVIARAALTTAQENAA